MTDNQPAYRDYRPPPHYFEEGSSFIIDLILFLFQHIKVILITPTIICTWVIIQVLFFTDPVYTSTSKIMSSSGGGSVSQAVGIAAKFGVIIPGQSESSQKWVYSEIIKSRTLSRSILNRKFDTEEFGPKKSLLQILTYGNDDPEHGMDTLEIRAVNILLAMIDVSENIATHTYTVNIHASEPRMAAEINKILIEELDIYQREFNRAKTSETRKFIEERIVASEKELMKAEEALKTFMDRNRRIENSPALQLEKLRLSREVTVLIGVFTTLKQQFETIKIEEVKEQDYVVILDPPEIPIIRSAPKKKKIVILTGFFGIGLGIGIAYVREYVKSRKEKEKEKIMQALSLLIKDFTQMYHTLLRFLKSIIPFKIK